MSVQDSIGSRGNTERKINVPLFDLKATFDTIWPQFVRQFDQVMARGKYSHGLAIQELEHVLSAYIGNRCGVAVNSGFDAVAIVLRGLGIQRGEEVVVSAYGFAGTALSVASIGATPVFADCEVDRFSIDLQELERAISVGTRAAVVSAPFGQLPNIEHLLAITKPRGIPVIIDWGDALPAKASALPIEAQALSFTPGAVLGSIGDGGMILSDDIELARVCSMLRHHGRTGETIGRLPGVSNRADICGTNSKMDDIQAAFLLAQTMGIGDQVAHREKWLCAYHDILSKGGESVTLPLGDVRSSLYQGVPATLPIRVRERDQVLHRLRSAGIDARAAYPRTIPSQPCFAENPSAQREFPGAAIAARNTIELPLFSDLTKESIEYVGTCIREFCQH